MLAQRQPDLTVCLENVHKTHNLSAMVRTCDAVGVHEVHAIWHDRKTRMAGGTATGSQNWVNVVNHNEVASCIAQLKQRGMQVLATHLSATAVDFRDIDYTRPTAILMGQEKHGITAQALALADQDIIVPMVGMVQSLNVSVATAVLLYEAQRQRQQAGMYNQNKLADEEWQRVLFEGGYPELAKRCRRKKLAYPGIDEAGQIIADEDWWQTLRHH